MFNAVDNCHIYAVSMTNHLLKAQLKSLIRFGMTFAVVVILLSFAHIALNTFIINDLTYLLSSFQTTLNKSSQYPWNVKILLLTYKKI